MQKSLYLADYYFIFIYSLSLLRNGNSILVLLGGLALIFPYEHHTTPVIKFCVSRYSKFRI